MKATIRTAVAALTACVFLAACAGQDSRSPGFIEPATQPAQPAAAVSTGDAAAAAYCKAKGGHVERRYPAYGTNSNPKGTLRLAGEAGFCYWIAKNGGSRIYLLLATLYTKMPTLAALAYYGAPKVPKTCGAGGANPASCYCTYLGGSDLFGGANLAGGAWVNPHATTFADLETCVFPDMSSIDSWGLTYKAYKDIRGIDLSTVLRYHKPS